MKRKPRADDFLAHDWEKAKMSIEERIRRKSLRNRWFDFDDLKTLGLIILGVLFVLFIGWMTDNPQDRPHLIEYENDPRR